MAVLPLLIQSDVLFPTYQLKSFPRICHKQTKEFLPFRMKEWLNCCMDVCSSYKYGSDTGLERLSHQSQIISIDIRISLFIKGESETCPISEIAIIILSLKFIGSTEAAAFSFTNLFFPPSRFSFRFKRSFSLLPSTILLQQLKKNDQQKKILSALTAIRNTRVH